MSERQKVILLSDLRAELVIHREAGEKIVLCHGCFDIVHPGHVRYLQFARAQGDMLVVSVSADAAVHKGPGRPLIPEAHRAENLAALACVDRVIIEHHPTAEKVLEALQPDIYVKGREYETSVDPRFLAERAVVEGYGGSVLFGSGDVVYSSTALIQQAQHRLPAGLDAVKLFRERAGIDLLSLDQAFEVIRGQRILVIGDLLLDRYIMAERARVASEAPVLSVSPVSARSYPGGAGIVARTLARFGVSVTLLSAADGSEVGDEVQACLRDEKVNLELIDLPGRVVPEKVRYLVDERVVFKVDRAQLAPLPSVHSARLADRLQVLALQADAVIVVDFGLGHFDHRTFDVLERVALKTPVYVDVSMGGTASILNFRKIRAALPSEAELRFALGDDSAGLSNLAARYFQQTESEFLIITLAQRGFLLFERADPGVSLPADHLPALGPFARDNVGAGDVLLALTAAVDAVTGRTHLAAFLGALCAAVHIQQIGNDPIDPSDARALGATLLGG